MNNEIALLMNNLAEFFVKLHKLLIRITFKNISKL